MGLERKNGHKTVGGIMLFSDMNASATKRGGGGRLWWDTELKTRK
jgi:hypothetical protein